MTTVDVSSHRNAAGDLYMPSQPWGVHFRADMSGEPGRLIGSESGKTKRAVLEKAQAWCDRAGRSAEVFRRVDGKVSARYWHDGEFFQHIEY